MRLAIDVTADLSVPWPTPALLQIEASMLPDSAQTVNEASLVITPHTTSETFSDFYANSCRRLLLPQGDTRVVYRAVVTQPDTFATQKRSETLPDVLRLPAETLLYLLPSRYCPSDRLVNAAQDQFGQIEPGRAQVETICQWINAHIRYQYGTSNAATSALDTLIERQGVCRDFAHLGIAFCRALNIPARYISGYCLGLNPPDFHAFFQAYLSGSWVSFDPTVAEPRPALVQIALGRDAADCAWSTFYGQGETRFLSVSVGVA